MVKRILVVVGSRPEAIKLAPVIKALQTAEEIETQVCVTAQHRDMLDQVLDLFKIIPDIDLNLMTPNQALPQLTARILESITPVLEDFQPDWVIVQGDTSTAMAVSLAAYYQKIMVAHVEAGLRTDSKWEPFPEEVNRRITSVIADFHFAPTEKAKQNLLAEGVAENKIQVVGNTVIDALHLAEKIPFDPNVGPLSQLPSDKEIVLVTAHRRENFGEPLLKICQALLRIADEYGDKYQLVFPVHPNPNMQQAVNAFLSNHPGITLLPPLDYRTMIYLMETAKLILTDSGGIQEEAPSLGTPVLVLRNKTERYEGIAAGCAKLVGTDPDRIVAAVVEVLENSEVCNKMSMVENPYGDGHASRWIVERLLAD